MACEIGSDVERRGDVEGSRSRLPEASQTPPGAASSAPPSFAYRLEAYGKLLLSLADVTGRVSKP
jgi:hypothetical protein